MFQRKIDGDADERRAKNDGTNLRLEGLLVERVVVKLGSGNVACTSDVSDDGRTTSHRFGKPRLTCELQNAASSEG